MTQNAASRDPPLAPGQKVEPVNLIIDTDPGVDDILSFILALSLPHVNLLALSLTFGNTTLDYARDNVLRLFGVLRKQYESAPEGSAEREKWGRLFEEGAKPIDLALGAEGPLGGRQRFTASYFHGRDGLSSVAFLKDDPFPLPVPPPVTGRSDGHSEAVTPYVPSPLRLSSSDSASLLLSHLASHPPNTVRIAAVGPLTNLALAWQKDPHTFARVGLISVMGGALDVPGNTAPNSEFNTYADPWAAKVLFEEAVGHEALKSKRGQRLPIELLPLDITGRSTVPYSRLMSGGDKTPLSHFITSILTHPRQVTNSYAPTESPFDPTRYDLFQAHDPLAVAHACFASRSQVEDYHSVSSAAIEPDERRSDESGWEYQERHFAVETEGTLTRGMCVVDRREHGGAKRKVAGKSRAQLVAEEEAREAAAAKGEHVEHKVQDEHAAAALPGLVSVVTESPAQGKWFPDVFCWSLGC